jgi:uncharacterized membrane protein YdjX (TVP38/TMEM64 family)
VTALAAVSDIKIEHFLIALLPAKLIMILSLAFIGFNIYSFWENPLRSLFLILFILVFNYLGRRFMHFYHKKFETEE